MAYRPQYGQQSYSSASNAQGQLFSGGPGSYGGGGGSNGGGHNYQQQPAVEDEPPAFGLDTYFWLELDEGDSGDERGLDDKGDTYIKYSTNPKTAKKKSKADARPGEVWSYGRIYGKKEDRGVIHQFDPPWYKWLTRARVADRLRELGEQNKKKDATDLRRLFHLSSPYHRTAIAVISYELTRLLLETNGASFPTARSSSGGLTTTSMGTMLKSSALECCSVQTP